MSRGFVRGTAADVPTTVVTKGEFIDYLQVRGEVRAVRSVPLTVPTTGRRRSSILELAKNGMSVTKGDVVVRFDPMSVQRTLNDRRSGVQTGRRGNRQDAGASRIQEQQTQTDVTKARYDVKRAELDTVPHEFLPRVEREQKMLKLSDANAKLGENERKLKALSDIEKAELASKVEKRDKARFNLQHAERQLGGLDIVSPVDGVVSIMPNWRQCCPPPDFKSGDRAWPGQVIAEVPICRRCVCPPGSKKPNADACSRASARSCAPTRCPTRRCGARSRTSAHWRASIFPAGRRSATST